MRKICSILFFLFFFIPSISPAQINTISSFSNVTARSHQLLGKIDSSISFTVPTIYGQPSATKNLFSLTDPSDSSKLPSSFHFLNKKGIIEILPVSLIQQFNSHHPYGWNDGAMIAAKGYQSMFSGGFYASIGPLEIRCQPEIVYADNKVFENLNGYGTQVLKPYTKIFAGQSSLSLSTRSLALGISSENLWWGPGINSSLLMSNNAPGFAHIFFKSRKPVSTPIGSFEWQIIAGKLTDDENLPYENRNLDTLNLLKNWRYLSAFVITYHPKWVPGLFLGFTRAVQFYQNEINIGSPGLFEKYIPALALGFQKKNLNSSIDDNKNTDQLASFFLRWVQPKANLEFYLEYGFNDYGFNIRDYVMSPSHSAAYIVGFKKIMPLQKKLSRLELGLEITQMSESPDHLVRQAGNWYKHGQIIQGYTNNNQIMGAGAGFGANVQSLNCTMVSGWRQWGILLERVERDPLNHINNWVDFGIGVLPQHKYKNFIFSGKFQFINSSNYAWLHNENRFNFHGVFKMVYLL